LSSAEDDSANLAGGPYATNSGVTLYSTYDLIISNQAGLPTALGGYISHFKDAGLGFSFHARVFISTSNYLGATFAPPGSFYIGIGNGSLANGTQPGSTAVVQLPDVLTTGVVYTVVTRCVLGNDQQSTIWINPSLESDPSATATDFNDPTNQADMNCYAFRQNGGGGTVYIDNLKVGTHFADVAGANTAPTISSIPDQDIPASSNTGPLDFTVDDAETPGSLTVTATSSNPTLIPNDPANLTLAGSGASRTITVTPVAGLQGQSTITVNVSDSVNTSFTTFLVRVGAPTISDIPNQMAITNTPIPPISFTVSDAESDALTLYGSSSNPALLTSGNIVFGGSGSSRTVTLTPEPDQSGVTTVHVDVTDGQTTNSASFTLTVSPLLGLVFADDFSYTSFTQPNALYLATDSPWQTVPPGTAFEVQVTNGLAYLSYTNTEDLSAGLTNAPYFASNAVVFYTGFTVNFSYLPSSAGNYFLHFSSSDSDTLNFRCRVFAQTNGAADGSFRLALSINSAVASAQFPLDLDLNTTYTVVTRYNSGTSESSLWVNPTSESSTSVSATDQHNTSTVGAISLRETSGIGNLAIGALKVGTKFSDVLPVTAPTPEPLQIAQFGSNVVLSWTNSAFTLTSASTAGGPYGKIDGATSPYTNAITGDQSYFRLQYP